MGQLFAAQRASPRAHATPSMAHHIMQQARQHMLTPPGGSTTSGAIHTRQNTPTAHARSGMHDLRGRLELGSGPVCVSSRERGMLSSKCCSLKAWWWTQLQLHAYLHVCKQKGATHASWSHRLWLGVVRTRSSSMCAGAGARPTQQHSGNTGVNKEDGHPRTCCGCRYASTIPKSMGAY